MLHKVANAVKELAGQKTKTHAQIHKTDTEDVGKDMTQEED